MKNIRIHTMIDAYLAKRIKSKGGWAPVSEPDLIALVDIIDKLVTTKYSADPDGDYPIEYCVVDRTTCEPMQFRGIPYPPKIPKGKAVKPKDVLIEAIRFEMAQYNLEIAMSQFRDTIRPIRGFVQELAESASEMEAESQQDNGPVDRLGV